MMLRRIKEILSKYNKNSEPQYISTILTPTKISLSLERPDIPFSRRYGQRASRKRGFDERKSEGESTCFLMKKLLLAMRQRYALSIVFMLVVTHAEGRPTTRVSPCAVKSTTSI